MGYRAISCAAAAAAVILTGCASQHVATGPPTNVEKQVAFGEAKGCLEEANWHAAQGRLVISGCIANQVDSDKITKARGCAVAALNEAQSYRWARRKLAKCLLSYRTPQPTPAATS